MTTQVSASGGGGFTVGSTAGSGGSHATTTIANGALNVSIDATGGGFGGASHSYTGKSVADIAALAYKYTKSAGSTSATMPIKIDVTGATACEAADPGAGACSNLPFAGGVTTLVFEPYYTYGNLAFGTADTLAVGNKWWSTRGIKGAKNRDTFVSLQSIIAANPGMQITRIYVDAGQNSAGAPWASFSGSVDFLDIGFAGQVVDRYDFG